MKFWSVIAVLIGYLCIFVGANSFAAEPTKLLIAHGAISNNVEPLWIAKEQGIFRKYGIRPN
jgi:ABC-type nitrate/sulfonate/bicarbonate transport system substrate-binding protein